MHARRDPAARVHPRSAEPTRESGTGVRSIGLPGVTDVALLRRLAPRIEAAGYRALWLNDAAGESLVGLAAAAEVTTTLGLATGVIAADRVPAARIADEVRRLSLDSGRVRIGVGSGSARHGLALLDATVAELRAAVSAPIVVAALGPRTRRLAARIADGVLLTWLSPAAARAALDDLRADTPPGRAPRGILYARTIADAAAASVLAAEADRYAGIPAYAANFARLGLDPLDATIDLSAAPGDPREIDAFASAVDELVLRVITPNATEDEIVRVIEAGAPRT